MSHTAAFVGRPTIIETRAKTSVRKPNPTQRHRKQSDRVSSTQLVLNYGTNRRFWLKCLPNNQIRIQAPPEGPWVPYYSTVGARGNTP